MNMKKEDLLFEDWKECMTNIRFYRDQINKMSLWEFALFPAIGITVATKFLLESNQLYAGITLIFLSLILGFIDNLCHLNARYSLINIKIAKELEIALGTSLISRVSDKYAGKLKDDEKSFFAKLNLSFFHINRVSELKYFIFLVGTSLVVNNYLNLVSIKLLVIIWIIIIGGYIVGEKEIKAKLTMRNGAILWFIFGFAILGLSFWQIGLGNDLAQRYINAIGISVTLIGVGIALWGIKK